MAELAFRVNADYEEVIKLRGELVRLRDEMMRVDTSTEEGRAKMINLQSAYNQASIQLRGVVNNASEYAQRLRVMGENASRLENAFRFGRTFDGNKHALKEWVKSLSSDLNQVRQQIKDTRDGIARDARLKESLERDADGAEQVLNDLNAKIAQYKFEENEAIGKTLNPLSRAVEEKKREVESLKEEIERAGQVDEWVGKAQALMGMKARLDTIGEGRNSAEKNQKNNLNAMLNAGLNDLGLTRFAEQIEGQVGGDWGRVFIELEKIANGNIDSIEEHLSELQVAYRSAVSEMEKVSDTYEKTKSEIEANKAYDTEFKVLEEQAKAAEEQVDRLNGEIYKLNNGEIGSGKTTEQLDELEQKSGELEAKLKGFRERIKDDKYSSNMFAGLTQGLQGLMGAYTAASGVLAQFGVDEEDLQKVQTKLQASMSILIGLQQVFNALNSESAFRTKVLNKVMIALSKAYQRVAASSTLAKLGIAGLVIGVVAATAAIAVSLSKTSKANKELNDHIKKTSDSAAEQVSAFMQLSAQWRATNGNIEKQNELLKSSRMGKFAEDIKTVSDAQKTFVENSPAYIRALISQVEAEVYLEQAREKTRDGVKAMMEADKYREKYENASNGLTRTYYHNKMMDAREEANSILGGSKSEVGQLLKKAEDSMTKAYAGGVTNAMEEETKARNSQLAKMARDKAVEDRRRIEDAELETRQMRISMMKDTAAKELAQLQLDFDKETKTRERQKEDRIRQLQEEQKAIWQKANPNRQDYEFSSSINSLPEGEQKQYQEQTMLAEKQFEKAKKELLETYGDVDTRRKALVESWEETLAPITDSEVKKILETERDVELANFDYDNIVDSGKVEEIMDKLRKKIEAEAERIKDKDLKEAFLAKGMSEVADMAYENASKYGTRADIIKAFQDKTAAEAKTITDKDQRDVYIAQRNAELAQMQYGSPSDYNDYDSAVQAANAIYEAKKKELELRKDNLGLMRLETEHQKEIYDIEIRFTKDLALVFGNISDYSREQLARAKEIAREALKNTTDPKTIKDLQGAINQIDDAAFEKKLYRGRNDLYGLIQDREYRKDLFDRQFEALQSGDVDEAQRLQGLMDSLDEKNVKNRVMTGIGLFNDGLNSIASTLGNLAAATGNVELEGVANALSDAGGVLNSTMQGFQQGGFIGAAIGAATSILSGITDAFIGAAAAAHQYQMNIDALHESYRRFALDEMMKNGLDSIFGIDSESRIKNYVNVLQSVTEHQEVLRKSTEEQNKAIIESRRQQDKLLYGELWQRQMEKDGTLDYGKASARLEDFRITTQRTKGFLGIGARRDMESLKELADKTGFNLYDKNGQLNAEFLKELLNTYKDITEEEKRFIEQAIADSEKYSEAIEGIRNELRSVFGDMSSQLADATINGLRSGAQLGAYEMKQIMGGTIKDLQKQMVQGVYQKALSKYEDELVEMVRNNASPQAIAAKYDEILTDMMKVVPIATDAAQKFDDWARSKGYELDEMENADASRGSVQNVSETTASAIEGRLSALQIASETKTQYLGYLTEGVNQITLNALRSVTLSEDIRNIQSDAYIAVLAIRDNTAGNLAAVKDIQEKLTAIESRTRNLL